MKTKRLRAGMLAMAAVGVMLVAGCVVRPDGRIGFEPVVVAPAPVVVEPPPPVEVTVGIPDDYVWDGYEYVGVVGDQYYYLGPGNVWLIADPFRLDRFHGWEHGHPDWRSHAIRNDRYRADRNGHVHPRNDHGHDHR